MNKRAIAVQALAGCFAMSAAVAFADVTGDFKVVGSSYINDVATVAGTVNRGAIQSDKTVVVEVTYDYSFRAEKTEVIAGGTEVSYLFIPGKCNTGIPNTNGCFDQNGQPKDLDDEKWGTTIVSTVTTPSQTIVHRHAGTQGMTAITEPTIEKGRLNPKGKITGYNWTSTLSIVPNDDLVDPSLIPDGYTVAEVNVVSVSYVAWLEDKYGIKLEDTVVSGALFPLSN